MVSVLLYVLLGVFVFDTVARVFCISLGHIPQRTPLSFALDTVLGVVFAVWIAIVVAGLK